MYSNNNTIQSNITAKQSITSAGNVTVQEEATMTLKAGQRVTLNNSFSAQGELHIRIEPIEDCQ